MIRAQTPTRQALATRAASLGRLWPAALVAAAYAVAGTAWILLSEMVVARFLADDNTLLIQGIKGIGFVVVTSVALYLVLGRVLAELRSSLATQAALASEVRTRAREQRRLAHRLMKAEEDTRRAVAKDLHDGPLQSLTLTFMQLDAALRSVEEGGPVDPERVGQAMTAVRSASEEIRAVVRALRPPLLAELGLVAALERHCNESARRAERDVTFEGDSALPTLDGQASIAVFRILQEAIANALKHTHDGPIRVRLRHDGTHLDLEVADEGPGFFHVSRAAGRGLGLVSMRERAESVGGTFSIASNARAGTVVRVRIPLESADFQG